MANEQDVHPEHQRKTISLSHKQAGTIGAAAAILMLLQPLLEMFQTKDASKAQMQVIEYQMSAQQRSIEDLKIEVKTVNGNVISARADIMTTFKEFAKAQRERDQEAVIRQKELDDRQDRRIEFVEANQYSGRKPTSRN